MRHFYKKLRSIPTRILTGALLPLFFLLHAACTPSVPKNPFDIPPPVITASPAPDAVEPGSAESSADPEASTAEPSPTPEPDKSGRMMSAKYLGIDGGNARSVSEVRSDGAAVYRFLVYAQDGGEDEERLFSVKTDPDFSIQNVLMEQYDYILTVRDDTVISANYIGSLESERQSPVSYSPGERTLKNLLAAAMQPVGSTLYVYGGGWSWQDDGASQLARRIGVSRTWREFFLSNGTDYAYRDDAAPDTSYYPFGGWCEYYYAGLDCSGYLGWVLYNTFETENGKAGYVYKSTKIASTLADEYGFGTFSTAKLENGGVKLRSGDVVSFNGHAYLVLGRCADGSLLILHSTPSASVEGFKGGGVQLSAIAPNGSSDKSIAHALALHYTEKYFPEWAARYKNVTVPYSTYIDFERKSDAGFFRWSIGSGGALTDPDGYLEMSAEEILKDLFGE